MSVVTGLLLAARSQVLSASRGDSVERSARTHRSAGSDVLALLHFAPFLFWASARAEGERERARCLVQIPLTHSAEDLAVKPCAFVRLHTFSQILHSRKKEWKKKRSARGEGRRNNQNATRIRWDPTPEREREAAGVGCKENEREKEEEWGNIWHFVCHNAFLTLKEELWGTFG